METDSDTGDSELSHYAYRVSMAADNRSGWDYNDIKGGHETLHRILCTIPEVVRTGSARERCQAVLSGGAHPPGAEAHALWHERVSVATTGKQWERPDPEVLIHGGHVSNSLAHVSSPSGTPSVHPSNATHSRGWYVAVLVALAVAAVCTGWYATKGAQRARFVAPDTLLPVDDE